MKGFCLAPLLGALLAFLPGSMFAQEKNVPNKATLEIQRRGNMAEVIDQHIRNDANSLFAQALSVPQDDSHKFFITVLKPMDYRCEPCDLLVEHLKNSQVLRPWVDVNNHENSFMHCNIDFHPDKFRPKKWEGIKVLGYPTIILQPPLNGQFGSPNTVINQKTGYNGKPEELDDWIRKSLEKYVKSDAARPIRASVSDAVAGPPPFDFPRPNPSPLQPSVFPDLVPTDPEPLTVEQIQQLVPDAPMDFIHEMILKKPKDAAAVITAWRRFSAAKKTPIDKYVVKPEPNKEPTPAVAPAVIQPASGLGSGLLVKLLLGVVLSSFGLQVINMGAKAWQAYTRTTPSQLDDIAADKLLEILQRKLDDKNKASKAGGS